ncbi:hypothetical protein JAAARDRAFT_208177 [Jaapia argillacea MUCL 33604]|uniref:Uncharacterized protein n=1 Tax=Jaapia argillacea MUCL 33604 TaxID=933084 RepID=A0A067PQ40_9AGAM|nr:hypothetical protein JAAARDRAFT_208177 [Jaapia argillacea MUCL 33604]
MGLISPNMIHDQSPRHRFSLSSKRSRTPKDPKDPNKPLQVCLYIFPNDEWELGWTIRGPKPGSDDSIIQRRIQYHKDQYPTWTAGTWTTLRPARDLGDAIEIPVSVMSLKERQVLEEICGIFGSMVAEEKLVWDSRQWIDAILLRCSYWEIMTGEEYHTTMEKARSQIRPPSSPSSRTSTVSVPFHDMSTD